MTHQPIPVICDRCRAEAATGEDPFEAFGELLEFEPVPRRSRRADGWDAEVQRAYIAALSLTGNDRAACRAVGRAQHGVTQLLAHEESEGFRAAREQALDMAASERSHRLAEGLRSILAGEAGWRPADPAWASARHRPSSSPAPAEEEGPAAGAAEQDFIVRMLHLYLQKLNAERKARRQGRIVAADFYLRQASYFEALLDLGCGGEGWRVLEDLRAGRYDLVQIAETPMSRTLDEARRAYWTLIGEPPRPEPVPRDLVVEHDGYFLLEREVTKGGLELSHAQQRQIFKDRHEKAAAEQVRWEAEARRDYERRRSAESKADDAQQRSDLVERRAAAAGVPSASESTTDGANSLRDGPFPNDGPHSSDTSHEGASE